MNDDGDPPITVESASSSSSAAAATTMTTTTNDALPPVESANAEELRASVAADAGELFSRSLVRSLFTGCSVLFAIYSNHCSRLSSLFFSYSDDDRA